MDATAEFDRIGGSLHSRGPARPADLRQIPHLINLKGGNLFLEEFNVTSEVAPGGRIGVDARVSNGALTIVLDPDECDDEANPCDRGVFDFTPGFCYELIVSPQWGGEETTGPSCVKMSEVTIPSNDHSLSLTAPQQTGTFTVQATLRALGTGEEGTFVDEITVTQDPSPRPPDNGNGGNGDDDILGDIQNVLLLLIVLAGVGIVTGE